MVFTEVGKQGNHEEWASRCSVLTELRERRERAKGVSDTLEKAHKLNCSLEHKR